MKFQESTPLEFDSQINTLSNNVLDKYNLEVFESNSEVLKEQIKQKYLTKIEGMINVLTELADKIRKS